MIAIEEVTKRCSKCRVENLKVCTKCKQEFPATVEFFVVDGRNKSGLGGQCRECNRERGRRYREQNLKKCNEASRKWREQNSEELREKSRRPEVIAARREYYQKPEVKERIRKYRQVYNPQYKPCPVNEAGIKICTVCKNKYLGTIEFFGPRKKSKDGLTPHCRFCLRENNYRYRATVRGRLMNRYSTMVARCNDEKAIGYERYGACGIRVEFEDSTEFFEYVINVMGITSVDQLTGKHFHRINPSKGYAPGNLELLTKAAHERVHVDLRKVAHVSLRKKARLK